MSNEVQCQRVLVEKCYSSRRAPKGCLVDSRLFSVIPVKWPRLIAVHGSCKSDDSGTSNSDNKEFKRSNVVQYYIN